MMMSRSNLSEQLKECNIPTKNDWPPSAFSSSVFAPASSSSSRYLRFAFFLLLVTIVFLITKQVRQNKKSMGRLLLPLSM